MSGAFGTSLADYAGTIPGLLQHAADRDPGGIWLRTDDLTLTFAEAAGRVAAVAAELGDRGIGHADLVMLTARTTPEYLFSWLALAALGAIAVPVNPASTPAGLAGLINQAHPRAALTDPGIYVGGGEVGEGAGRARPRGLGEGGGAARAIMGGNELAPRRPRQPARPDDADNPLRLCYAGPAPERERQEQIEQRFGIRIVVGYAMSESPYGLVWPHGRRPFGTLGSARQHPYLGTINEAKVVKPGNADGEPGASADGEPGASADAELGPGETGEILLRNPVITPGYWGMPEETLAAKTADGWLHTGDLVTVNADGPYTFVGRRKEVLRRRGENLSPLEVEEVLDSHPAVLESAVVGVASDLTEEEIKAFVVPIPGAEIDMRKLRVYAAERLSAFKVPRFWQLLDALPRTPTARIAKHRLPAGHQPGEYDAEAG